MGLLDASSTLKPTTRATSEPQSAASLSSSLTTRDWVARSKGTWSWRIDPRWLAQIESDSAPDWFDLGKDPRAEKIKSNDGREVWRVELDHDVVFAKITYPSDRWARWRRRLLGSDADREYRVAAYAESHGIATIRPIALAHRPLNGKSASSILITKGEPTARPMNELWLSLNGSAESTRLQKNLVIDAAARLLAQAHQNGFDHSDLHAGNVLVDRTGAASYRTFFVDLQSIHLNRPVGDRAVVRNLAQFNQWFRRHAPLTDRVRFLDRYLYWRDCLEQTAAFGHRLSVDRHELLRWIDAAARRHAKALYAKRDRRVFRDGRYFGRIRCPDGWTGPVYLKAKRPDPNSRISAMTLTREQWRQWLSDPLGPLSDVSPEDTLKVSASGKVCRVRLPLASGQDLEVVYKRKTPRRWTKRIKTMLYRPWARLTWKRANGLLHRQIPTALPLAVLQRRRFGILTDGIMVSEFVPDSFDLDKALNGKLEVMPPRLQRRFKHHLISSLAQLIRQLHERGFRHRDLKAQNILVQWSGDAETPPRVLLVDLDGVRPIRRPSRRSFVRTVMRLNVSLDHCKSVSRTDRLRFLVRCLARPGCPEPKWKDLWHEIEAMSERKRHQRRKR